MSRCLGKQATSRLLVLRPHKEESLSVLMECRVERLDPKQQKLLQDLLLVDQILTGATQRKFTTLFLWNLGWQVSPDPRHELPIFSSWDRQRDCAANAMLQCFDFQIWPEQSLHISASGYQKIDHIHTYTYI